MALLLTNEEQIVHDYLAEQWMGFERRFCGALRVLADPHNPERFCHAAHTLREIMTEMENRFSGRHIPLGTRMKNHLANLASTRKAVSSFADSTSTGPPDIYAAVRYIEVNEAFLREYEGEQDVIRRRVENLLMEMDPAVKSSLPGWRARLSSEWRQIKESLVHVAHGDQVTESDFLSVKEKWVAFLIDRARPQTTADQNNILQLIAELENCPNANS